ncbi:MAG: hypothetical protein JNL98_26935 [Bryobacterales bacterium]|nr:hypothetical protein [Bryobacterales bacterium]
MEQLRDVQRAQPWIHVALWYNLLLGIVSAVGFLLDGRQVTGVNPWLKPLKFEVSIILFLATAAWMLAHLPVDQVVKRTIGNGIAVAMAVEISAIVVQAARGARSHFNHDTPLDSAIFALMGVMIGINTLLMAWMLLLYFRTSPDLAPALLWGVRLGLVLFLMASIQGFLIVGNRAHTVGAPDGGPGLLFLNWSTRFGDLRVAHFLGMHGIQILPLLGWLASRNDRTAGVGLVVVVFVILFCLFAWSLLQALAGKPVLRLT